MFRPKHVLFKSRLHMWDKTESNKQIRERNKPTLRPRPQSGGHPRGRGVGEVEGGTGVKHRVTEGDLTLGGINTHAMHKWCITELYPMETFLILFINITPIHLIKFISKHMITVADESERNPEVPGRGFGLYDNVRSSRHQGHLRVGTSTLAQASAFLVQGSSPVEGNLQVAKLT